MKSTATSYAKEIKYPVLKQLIDTEINKKLIVLFYKKDCGIAVYSVKSHWPLGHYSEEWDMSEFKDYDGKVTLEND
jgi:hypothetical protein